MNQTRTRACGVQVIFRVLSSKRIMRIILAFVALLGPVAALRALPSPRAKAALRDIFCAPATDAVLACPVTKQPLTTERSVMGGVHHLCGLIR